MREKYPELPYFLMGHSMGSFIAREFAAAYGNSLTAVVFMGTSAGISTPCGRPSARTSIC